MEKKKIIYLAVLASSLLPTSLEAQITYRFKCQDYVSTDDKRAPQSAFSYDAVANHFSISVQGDNNIAFKMKGGKDNKYFILPDEKFFIVSGKNLKQQKESPLVWWLNGANTPGAQADSVYVVGEETIYLWNLETNTQVNKNFNFNLSSIPISANNTSFILALGLTADQSDQPGVVTNVNYYAPYEMARAYPELMNRMGYNAKTLTSLYKDKLTQKVAATQELLNEATNEGAKKTLTEAISQANNALAKLGEEDYQKAYEACKTLEDAQNNFHDSNHSYSYEKTTEGIKAKYDDLFINIRFVNDSVAHVVKSYQEDYKSSEWVVLPSTQSTVSPSYSEKDGIVTVSTSKLNVTYDLAKSIIRIYDAQGKQLISEKSFCMEPCKDGPNDSHKIEQSFLLDTDEQIYGLGQIQDGKLNQRGQSLNLVQNNRSICIPYFLSSKNYSLYWDNYSPTTFNDDSEGTTFSSIGNAIDYYVLSGESSHAIQKSLRNLTGETKLPPLWNFGLYQSKERYTSSQEVLDVLQGYRNRQVPIDCIVQDWQYWGTDNNYWNSLEFLNPNYADYQSMINTIHDNNAKIMLSIWPDFGPATEPYKYFESKGRLIPAQSYPTNVATHDYDVYDKESRDYYWSKMYSGLVSHGIDAYWLDSTEPDYFGHSDSDFDYVTGTGDTWRALRNIFPLATVEGVYTHHRAEKKLEQKRVSIMTRSGFLGMQRTGAYIWSADITSSWTTLANQIPAACNVALCGLPYWNSDTGGFFIGSYKGGVNNDAWRRLYTRWTQFSTFTPMLRFHGTDTPREIWRFGEEGDAKGEYDNILKYIKLRYRLLPYLYAQAHQVVSNAESFMYALPISFPKDVQAREVKDQYMLGNTFLVAPIVQDGVTGRNVYLPAGTNWIDFWTGKSIKGGQNIYKTAPMNIMPLYVKAGSILPWGPEVQYSTEKPWDELEIRVYPGADGKFVLYEDENDNYNYEKGEYTEIPFTWDNGQKTLTIGDRKGQYKGMLNKRKFRIVVVGEGKAMGDEEATKYDKVVEYKGSEVSVSLPMEAVTSEKYVEVTDKIENPSFEADGKALTKQAPKGWDVEASTTWWGVNLSNNVSATGDPLATDGSYIFGVWDDATNVQASISQTLNTLEAGEYRLTVDMQASNKGNMIRLGNQRVFAGDEVGKIYHAKK